MVGVCGSAVMVSSVCLVVCEEGCQVVRVVSWWKGRLQKKGGGGCWYGKGREGGTGLVIVVEGCSACCWRVYRRFWDGVGDSRRHVSTSCG